MIDKRHDDSWRGIGGFLGIDRGSQGAEKWHEGRDGGQRSDDSPLHLISKAVDLKRGSEGVGSRPGCDLAG